METICIGEIIATHGIKGELKVKSLTDFSKQRFKKGNRIYIEYQGDLLSVEIESFRMQQDLVLISLKGLDDINLIEKYKHCRIFFDKAQIPPLKKGEYYYFQLKGLDVIDQNGASIGTVIDIEETGANNCLRVSSKEKEILIPYVPAFILNVDLKKKQITIRVIEGLL